MIHPRQGVVCFSRTSDLNAGPQVCAPRLDYPDGVAKSEPVSDFACCSSRGTQLPSDACEKPVIPSIFGSDRWRGDFLYEARLDRLC